MMRTRVLLAAFVAVLACSGDVSAQVAYRVVADLASIGGAAPLGGVIRGADGALYGTASEGGASNCGIVYRLATTGALTSIHEFNEVDGCRPVGELALGPDGSLYGVTSLGGDVDPRRAGGTIYKIATDGTFSVLHRFVPPFDEDPEPWLVPYLPYAALTRAPDGFFYGTTVASDIFRISPEGEFALVHQFVEPGEPQDMRAALVLGTDGALYGTAPSNLSLQGDAGSIFRVSLAGDAEVLHRFAFFGRPPPDVPTYPEGARSVGELVEGPDGEFYGVNALDGPAVTAQGTIFRLDPDGALTILHTFSPGADQSYPDGAIPRGGLIRGTDGSIYGTTSAGGATGHGTIFSIGPDGMLTTLRSFADDGFAPTKGRLLEAVPGVLYGTAPAASGGVIYELRVGAEIVAEDASLSTDADQPVDGVLTAAGAGLFATFSIVTNGSLGTATVTDAATGAFTYTPNPGVTGVDSFMFRVSDGPLTSNVATVTITIAPSALSISLVAPLGGEKLFIGVPTSVQWIVAGAVRVDVELSRDAGRTFAVIPECAELPGSSTSCLWTPTGPRTSAARIRVVARDAAGGQASDVTKRRIRLKKAHGKKRVGPASFEPRVRRDPFPRLRHRWVLAGERDGPRPEPGTPVRP